ncbi:MAG: hypothetical protein ACRCZF_26210, partial [Gemmataceae bacterium]
NANIITPKALAEGAVEMAEEMLAHDEYEAALRLLSVADNAFLRANLAPSARELEARIPLIKKQREAFEPIRQAAQKLKTTPDDPAASTLVGRYRCFVQRRWDEGLKLLAVGNDAVLKKLAEQDVNIDTDLTDLKRGDAWAEYATSLTDAERAAVLARSKYWYAKALSSLKGGLERATAENRLAFKVGENEYRPGVITEVFLGLQTLPKAKRLGRLDPVIDITGPALRELIPEAINALQPNTVEASAKWTGVLVPPLPGRYKIVADTRNAVIVRLGAKPDEKLVVNAPRPLDSTKREGVVILTEKPAYFTVEYAGRTGGAAMKMRLMWVRPGSTTEELIPPECLFHSKADGTKLVTAER